MKFFVRNLTRLFLLMLVSCDNDNEPAPPQCYMMKEGVTLYPETPYEHASASYVEYAPDHSLVAITTNGERFTATLDDRGNIVRMTSTTTQRKRDFTYDDNNLLLTSTIETATEIQVSSYFYNANGQLKRMVLATSNSDAVSETFYRYRNAHTKNPAVVIRKPAYMQIYFTYYYSYDDKPLPTGKLNSLLFNPIHPRENNVTDYAVQSSNLSVNGRTGHSEYVYNAAGYPLKITEVSSDGSIVVWEYRYQCE